MTTRADGLACLGPEGDAAAFEAGFRRAGVGRLDGLCSAERAQQLRVRFETAYPQLANEGLIDAALVQSVSSHRYVVPTMIGSRTNCLDVLLGEPVTRAFDALLGPDWVYDSFGVIVSFPGARRQGVHRDGSPLFHGSPIERLLPEFALTLAVPLQPMDEVLGSTGFWPGTQIHGTEPDGEHPPLVPHVAVGSAAVWSYRISHCGMENRGQVPRPLLYATACRPFWHDYANDTPNGGFGLMVEGGLLDNLPLDQRARFRRAKLV